MDRMCFLLRDQRKRLSRGSTPSHWVPGHILGLFKLRVSYVLVFLQFVVVCRQIHSTIGICYMCPVGWDPMGFLEKVNIGEAGAKIL